MSVPSYDPHPVEPPLRNLNHVARQLASFDKALAGMVKGGNVSDEMIASHRLVCLEYLGRLDRAYQAVRQKLES